MAMDLVPLFDLIPSRLHPPLESVLGEGNPPRLPFGFERPFQTIFGFLNLHQLFPKLRNKIRIYILSGHVR